MLSQAQVETFYSQGYMVVENVLPMQVIDAVVQEYTGLMCELYRRWAVDGRVPRGEHDFWAQLSAAYAAGCDWFQPMDISLPGGEIAPDCPMHFGPAIFDLVVHDRLLNLIEALIGPEITSNPIQHVRIKPPAPQLATDEVRAHITATDWHQDRGVGHADADRTDMITAWVAITHATVENGCLQVVPGIEQGLLPHCPQVQTAIAPNHLATGRAVQLPVGPGGVVLFHPLVPHASLPNHSDGFRWSFDLRYNVTGKNTGRAHFPDFVARRRSTPQTDLRDWRVWRQMWFDARDRLATKPHIPIHRWDGSAPHCA